MQARGTASTNAVLRPPRALTSAWSALTLQGWACASCSPVLTPSREGGFLLGDLYDQFWDKLSTLSKKHEKDPERKEHLDKYFVKM